ncbi:MAG: DUF4242 domain-containing protein [Chloroflexi bacterium]|nr:DUF4242 domain-containing protein [Chloroflexota bacterium]
MAKYVVTHTPVVEEATQDRLIELLHAIAVTNVPDTAWLASWIAVDSSKMFCLWEAPGEDAIRTALGEEALKLNPIEALYEVVDVNPANFR